MREGEPLLWAALDNGIYIPHICAVRGADEPSSCCRLCFVVIEGRDDPVLSCSEPVKEGMIVNTTGEAALALFHTAFDLLLSTHPVHCKKCPGKPKCALREIAKEMKLKLKKKNLPGILPDIAIDESQPRFNFDPNRCVLCGRCVQVCNEEVKACAIDFINRGMKTRVGVFGGGTLADSRCISCLRCVEVCPVGAFYLKEQDTAKKYQKLSDSRTYYVRKRPPHDEKLF